MRDERSPPDSLPEAVSLESTAAKYLIPLGLWFGLVTGLGEVVLTFARRQLLGRFSNLGRDVLWMAPAADVIIFGTLGVVLFAVARWRKHERWLTFAIGLYAFLSVFTLLMMYYPLHPWARLVLATGLAVQFGRLSTPRRSVFLRVVDVTLAWPKTLWWSFRYRTTRRRPSSTSPGRRDFLLGTGATLGVLAIGAQGPPLVREWRGLRRPGPSRLDTPNVLFLVLDTVRAASLSLHGYHRDTTPELLRLSRRGVVFQRAYSHSPWTLPSHGSLFTGRYPHELSGTFQVPLDSQAPTIAEIFAANGYATAGFVGNTNYCSYESGLQRGFLHYEDYPISFSQMVRSSVLADYVSEMPAVAERRRFEVLGRKPAATINRAFQSWLADGGDRPFFALLNYFDAHAPYLPPPPFDVKFGSAVERPNARHQFSWQWTPEQTAMEMDAYESAIAYLDAEIGALIASLESRGALANTLIVVTSDHGELLGEHGLVDHANSLYAPLLHVPLMMIWPGQIPVDVRIQQPIGLRHVAATILDLLKIDRAGIRGRSLAPLWLAESGRPTAASEPILSSLEQGIRVDRHWRNSNGTLHSLIVGSHHYIQNSDGSEELYDLESDPDETRNLKDDPGFPGLRQTLKRMLQEGSA